MHDQDLTELQNAIQKSIPMIGQMGIAVRAVGAESATIAVPLLGNHNHKSTAFGGSLYAACTAACYSLLFYKQLQTPSLANADWVISKGSIEYIRPVDQDFFVMASVDLNQWREMVESLLGGRKRRITLDAFVRISLDGPPLCKFAGNFVLLPRIHS